MEGIIPQLLVPLTNEGGGTERKDGPRTTTIVRSKAITACLASIFALHPPSAMGGLYLVTAGAGLSRRAGGTVGCESARGVRLHVDSFSAARQQKEQ